MAGSNYIPTGLSKEAFDRMTNGVGAVYVDIEVPLGSMVYAEDLADIMEKAFDDGKCLGATNGGLSFDFGYDMNSIDTDGKTFEYVGSRSVTSTNGTISTNLQEVSSNSFSRMLPTSQYDESTGELTIRRAIPDEAYIKNLWAIVALRGGGYVGFHYENALAEGTSGSTSDDQPAEWSVTFTAHAKDITDSQTAPFRIKWFPVKDEEETRQGSGTQSASIGPTASKTARKIQVEG